MELSDLVKSILSKRGIGGEGIPAFLNPDYEVHTHAPELFHDMDVAVSRLLSAIAKGERVAVYADFDCDGIPGAALFSDFFQKIGYENFEVYLPHRDREGYGFHTEAIAQLAARGVKLIITVDVGTTAVEAVQFAKTKEVDVIVTDHHEILGELPDAVAVLNPKLVPTEASGIAPYPFPHLCGAATAFKLVQATLHEGKKRGIESFTSIPDGWEKWLLDLVAIATVADMVELTGENRVLVRFGLQVLHKTPRPGLNALFTRLRLRKSELTEDDIGFSIAPRVNAASRMDAPDLALKLLTTKDRDEAELLAAKLEELNASRKGVVGGIVREARKRVKGRFTKDDTVVVLGDPDWKPALLGLAANSIMGDRGGVVCMWGRDANGRIKGSCRSDGSMSVVELFTEAADAFEEYGGHAASGGFSVSAEKVHTLQEVLTKAALALKQKTVSDTSGQHDPSRLGGRAEADLSRQSEAKADALVTLREVALPLFRDIQTLSPFGVGNPKPVFCIRNVRVRSTKTFGKEKNHIELNLVCMNTGTEARAFDFFRRAEDFSYLPTAESETRILATIERDTYRGGLALRLVDVLPAA